MRMYRLFFAMHLKRVMAYRKSFFFLFVGQFLTTFTSILGLWFLMRRFGSVRGYRLEECLLCAGVMLLSFSLSECFFRGFDRFSSVVRSASFDRMMLRPRSLTLQVLCEQASLDRLSRALQGALMLWYGISRSPVNWTPWRFGILLLMILGGVVVFAGLFILYAALCFFTLEGLEFMNVFTDGAREYGVYPLDVYGAKVLRFCTFIIPYALFQYYPLMVLLGRTERRLLALTPLLTPLFLIPCLLVWRLGVRKYQSAGS